MTEPKSSIKKEIIRKLIIAGSAGLITYLLTLVCEYLNFDYLRFIKSLFLGFLLIFTQKITIQLWILICLGVPGVLAGIMYAWRMYEQSKVKRSDYTEDIFFDILWDWKDCSTPKQFLSKCPICFRIIAPAEYYPYPLIERDSESGPVVHFKCPTCGFIKSFKNTLENIQQKAFVEIEHNTNSEKWKNSLKEMKKLKKAISSNKGWE